MFCNGIGCPKYLSCKHFWEMTNHFARINNSCGNVYIKESECIDGGRYRRYERRDASNRGAQKSMNPF